MIIHYDPDDYIYEFTFVRCSYHEKHPKEYNYAGCTCMSSYTGRKRTWQEREKERMEPPCVSPLHSPPQHMVIPPGGYTHRCPSCGRTTKVGNLRPTW